MDLYLQSITILDHQLAIYQIWSLYPLFDYNLIQIVLNQMWIQFYLFHFYYNYKLPNLFQQPTITQEQSIQ
jgi:hypothetical protein